MTATVHEQPASRRSGWWIAAGVALIVLIGLGVWAYVATRPEPARVTQRDIVANLVVDGETAVPPSRNAVIPATFRAPVEKVDATVGEGVTEGDVLVELSFPTVEAALEQARRQVKAAETAYANARKQYSQQAAQLQQSADQQAATAQAPETDVSAGAAGTLGPPTAAPAASAQAQYEAQAARAAMDAALEPYRVQLQMAREALGQAQSGKRATTIRTPITGTVLALNAQPGEVLDPDQDEPVAHVVDLSALQVHVPLTKEQSGSVRKGMSVVVTFAEIPDHRYEGHVDRITTRASSKAAGLIKDQQYIAIVEIKNVEPLARPGMKPTVAFTLGRADDVLAVPSEAVDRDDQGNTVVNVRRDGRWEPAVVETGLGDGYYTEIKAGLHKGEVVQVTPSLIPPSRQPSK